MLTIGLTGGIGSGKSTVANLFVEKGITIIDTDLISRRLTQPEQPAFNAMVKRFGPQILNPDNSLNRPYLRDFIFKNPTERHWLEQLLHPLIRKTAAEEAALANSPYAMVVIPLLVETAHYPFINRILVVDAPEQQQIERVKQRDLIEENAIQAILEAQVSRAERLQIADDIIYNNGTLAELQTQVDRLHEFYLSFQE